MSSSSDEMKLTQEKMAAFIESLRKEKCEENLISLIKNIADGSLKSPADSFVNRESFRRKLSGFLARGFALKALSEDQILSFFDALFKNADFYWELGLDFIREIERYGDNEKTTLPSKLMSIYFKYAAEHKSAWKTTEACSLLTRRSTVSINTCIEGYKLKNKEEQEKLLGFFLELIIKHGNSELAYKLKTANPAIFKQVFDSLDENNQYLINKELARFYNPLISLIENNKFTEAAEVFTYHSESPTELFLHLNNTTEKIPDRRQIFNFFKALLDKDDVLLAFTAMRACFESKGFLNKYPDLFKDMMKYYLINAWDSNKTKEACNLLSSKPAWHSYILAAYNETTVFSDEEREKWINDFLIACADNLNAPLIQGLRKSTPNLFDKVLNLTDENTKKIITGLLQNSMQEDEKIGNELTLLEERRISEFNDFLKNPNNFSEAMEHISNVIDGKFYRDKYPNLPKTLISLYLKKAIELNKIGEAANAFSSNPLWSPHVLKAYQEQSKENQEKLIAGFLEPCGRKFNAAMMCGLKEATPELFDKVLKTVEDQELKKRIEDLLKVPVSARLSISDIMIEFTLPFRRMTAYAGQLVCVETNKRKPYLFNPTVLYNTNLREYLTILKSAKPPIRERFVLAGDHWIAGEIEISENGKPRILFIDSLGANEPKTSAIIRQQCPGIFEEPGKELEIYLSHGKRQHSPVGCTVFTLKDVQELFTVGNYLDPKYKGELFEYVSEKSVPDKYIEGLKLPVKSCTLPLRFMRSEQSEDLLNITLPNWDPAEKSLPINKRGELSEDSINKHFKMVGNKLRNERIAYKLDKMANRVFSYLSSHNFNLLHVESEMSRFSFESFKTEMELRNSDQSRLKEETKEKQEDIEVSGPSLLLTGFSAINRTGPKFGNESKETKERVETEKENPEITPEEQAMETIRNILLEKFKCRIFYLSPMIEDLQQEYRKGKIENVDTLKKTMKSYLEIREGEEHPLIDNESNKGYLNTILKSLPLIEKLKKPAKIFKK